MVYHSTYKKEHNKTLGNNTPEQTEHSVWCKDHRESIKGSI